MRKFTAPVAIRMKNSPIIPKIPTTITVPSIIKVRKTVNITLWGRLVSWPDCWVVIAACLTAATKPTTTIGRNKADPSGLKKVSISNANIARLQALYLSGARCAIAGLACIMGGVVCWFAKEPESGVGAG